jgi:two-component system, NtrC family, nitrogen regulation response regulator NtrX
MGEPPRIMTLTNPRRGFTKSAAMQNLVTRLQQAIAIGGGVLLRGESGSGRRHMARVIHLATQGNEISSVERLLNMSLTGLPDERPFVLVDCSEASGLEQCLFGARAGAQDPGGDVLDRITEGSAIGRALGGTLFLRQLTDMPAGLQLRLARILRDDEVWVEGKEGSGVSARRVGVRPIATSDAAADDERIVPELLKRLEHTRIDTPPLRNRREDIPALVRELLAEICGEQGIRRKKASSQAVELLSALPWRGNLRELRTFLTALVMKVPDRLIRQADVLASICLDGGPTTFAYTGTLKQARERFERDYVTSVLEQHRGRMAEAAKALGIQRTNLYRKVRQLSVKRRVRGRNTA